MSRLQNYAIVFLCVVLWTGSPSVVYCDTVALRDGHIITGKISGETAQSITIDSDKGRFTFPREKILEITRESAAQNQLLQMKKLIRAGKVDAAMLLYDQGYLKSQLSATDFNAVFQTQLKDTAVAVVCTSATALELSEHFTAQTDTPFELLLLGAVVCSDTGNPDEASALLRQAGKNVPQHQAWPIDVISGLLNRIVDTAIAKKQGTIIAEAASLSARLPIPESGPSVNYLTLYAQIDALTRKNRYLEAASSFRPDMFLHRADLFVPLAERLATAILAAPANASSLAALESAGVTVLPYVGNELRTRGMKTLVTRLVNNSRADDAQRITDETAKESPDLGATLQHLIDFIGKKAELPAGKPLDKYKLAAWARSMGLLDESKSLFLTLRGDPRFTETASLQLNIIDNKKAQDTLDRLKQLYEKSDIDRLKIESAEFLRLAPPEHFAQETRDLLQLADFEKWSRQKSSLGKAEAEFQQAERLANRREFDKALTHLNRIQMDQAGSAAAQKVQALRDRIMREQLRERLKKSLKAQ